MGNTKAKEGCYNDCMIAMVGVTIFIMKVSEIPVIWSGPHGVNSLELYIWLYIRYSTVIWYTLPSRN